MVDCLVFWGDSGWGDVLWLVSSALVLWCAFLLLWFFVVCFGSDCVAYILFGALWLVCYFKFITFCLFAFLIYGWL